LAVAADARAAARKCEKERFTWPPSPNDTRLEKSERATSMRDAYNKLYVPACTLTGNR
jgi:hypothetical protein